MSYPRRGRGYDPSEPSTSSGYHRSSSYSGKPYSRPSEKERYPPTKIKDRGYTPSSSFTYPERYETGQKEIASKKSSTDVIVEKRRRRTETIFVTKPTTLVNKKGTSGEHITLQTNYFKVLTVPDWCLYKYRVDYEPEETRTVIRKGMLKSHKEKIGIYIFDGTVLYTINRLPDEMELASVQQHSDTHIKIKIRLVGSMVQSDPAYIFFFNIIMRKCLENMKLQLLGRNYFDSRNTVNVREFRLELWPGYITSIRQHEKNILLCTEIMYKVISQDTLFDILNECYTNASHNFKREFCNRVIGLVVLTDYNNKTYRIEDVDFDTNPLSTFPMKDGKMISYQDYYITKYEIRIRYPTQPMLVTRIKSKVQTTADQGDLVYLVPELCRATGLSDQMRENYQVMRALANHTRINPASRIQKLKDFYVKLRNEPKVVEDLKNWNMTLDSSLVHVPARTLSAEKLIFGKNMILSNNRGDWTREMHKAPLWYSKELKDWVVMAWQRDKHNVQGFIDTLLKASKGLAFRVEYPRIYWLHDDKSSTYVEELEKILSKSVPELVFCIVSNNRSDRYMAIKKKCCVDRPIPSQVFLQKNLQSRNMSIATKVAIQMNCKLGGAPWCISVPLKGLMVIGFDMCHDAQTKGKDFLTMVATVDQSLTRFFSSITPYHSDEELVEQFCASISKALQAYRSHNKALPMYLVIYRDGVSEGEIQRVYEQEVTSLKKKLEELYYGPNFKMIYIVVSKKINTRFFCNKDNPKAGTIVDDIVTSPFKYDFFIVSQQIRQGTVTPTSYNVISDNTNLSPDMIQNITFKLTHLYYNCSNTVRVPAPCHYAHKLSFLVGRFLHRPPSTQLESQLFFL